jgi:hypothetical protein
MAANPADRRHQGNANPVEPAFRDEEAGPGDLFAKPKSTLRQLRLRAIYDRRLHLFLSDSSGTGTP